ncbi:MAG: ABC transporter ATP-binding protein, partial [Lentisphaerae bacterium]|nr:ABC transporter ATP-binding protein [Lentisphaerota bacterium]
ADVEDVCDRIAILYKGKVRACGRVRELLQEEHRVTIDTPSLPPETMQQVLSLIREKIGMEPDVDHPTMDLERFFLQVVREAHGNVPSDNGPSEKGRLAGYLSGSDD